MAARRLCGKHGNSISGLAYAHPTSFAEMKDEKKTITTTENMHGLKVKPNQLRDTRTFFVPRVFVGCCCDRHRIE